MHVAVSERLLWIDFFTAVDFIDLRSDAFLEFIFHIHFYTSAVIFLMNISVKSLRPQCTNLLNRLTWAFKKFLSFYKKELRMKDYKCSILIHMFF